MHLAFAHSENRDGRRHLLVEHLLAVAARAGDFAAAFGGRDLAYSAGLWHDLGKFHPDFQAYLNDPLGRRGPDHSSAGAVHAAQRAGPLAFLIAGHHAGLPSREGLRQRLVERSRCAAVETALQLAREALGVIDPPWRLEDVLPPWLRGQTSELSFELYLRMAFSALVDADFLDTEAHFDAARGAARAAGVADLASLVGKLEVHHEALLARPASELNRLRNEIYDHCLQAADLPPGLFRLTVPTGGGKTLSGMAFALRHALRHGLRRVVVAIPYTSIIEQTADVYRGVFGESVLEHHSAVGSEETDSPVTFEQLWARLASENWDAPIVVTTTVQLFESLFANRTSACRKLHNLAGSVLILDEAQTLPAALLDPILDVLGELVRHYRLTVVFCTATQPALAEGRYAEVLSTAREIVPEPGRFFLALQRVRYEVPAAREKWPWGRVADEMRTSSQCLAVVNTKADAAALLAALGDPEALHLSTHLCGAHRRAVLAQVRDRLAAGVPCRLVSTQVVEAGVDLDFPLVLRATGPLDRIVQAAGRANREGRLGPRGGRVVVFEPEEGKTPPGIYRTASDLARVHLAAGCDLNLPESYRVYFENLYRLVELDEKGIQGRRRELDYPGVAERFHLIVDDGLPVVVPYGAAAQRLEELRRSLAEGQKAPRWAFRRLQPYMVNVRRRLLEDCARRGLVEDVVPGLFRWVGTYDAVRGIDTQGYRPPESLIVGDH